MLWKFYGRAVVLANFSESKINKDYVHNENTDFFSERTQVLKASIESKMNTHELFLQTNKTWSIKAFIKKSCDTTERSWNLLILMQKQLFWLTL